MKFFAERLSAAEVNGKTAAKMAEEHRKSPAEGAQSNLGDKARVSQTEMGLKTQISRSELDDDNRVSRSEYMGNHLRVSRSCLKADLGDLQMDLGLNIRVSRSGGTIWTGLQDSGVIEAVFHSSGEVGPNCSMITVGSAISSEIGVIAGDSSEVRARF